MNIEYLNQAYLQIGSTLFILIILIMYMKRQNKVTLESVTFDFVLISLVVVLFSEINIVLAAEFSPSTNFLTSLSVTREMGFIIWISALSYYAFIQNSSKRQPGVLIKENSQVKYFKKIFYLYIILVALFLFSVNFLDIGMNTTGSTAFSNPTYYGSLAVKTVIMAMVILIVTGIYSIICRTKYKKTNQEPNKKKRIIIFLVIDLVVVLGTSFLPISATAGTGTILGPALIPKYILYVLLTIITTKILLQNAENFKWREILPFCILTPLLGTALIFESLIPDTLTIGIMMAFVTINMYYSLENPDEKMLEEINKNAAIADSANRQKTRFLSRMSHEIRTPLNAIIGFSQVLKEENISDEAREEVDDIIMSSNSLLEIVNGILDISKIETNKLEIENKEYDSKMMMKEVVALAKARLASRPIDLRINISENIPPVLNGDYLRVKQVFINILTNAIKYTREGSIDFIVNCETVDNKAIITFKVKDTGIGIKEEDLNKLFNRFQRLDLEKNSSTEGTGLGLAITKSLVELMNGTIDVKSEYGKGTEFNIKIEQDIGSKTLEDINKVEETTNETKLYMTKNILVVDDNTVNLKVTNRLLQKYNVNVTLANSGEECINLINSGKEFDLIFMDDMMPKMTGTEAMQILKGMSTFKTPIVALTANAISGMREKYIQSGFDEYLSKPIDKHQLNNIINYFLNKNLGYTTIEIKAPRDLGEKPIIQNEEITDLTNTKSNIDTKPVEIPNEEPKEEPAQVYEKVDNSNSNIDTTPVEIPNEEQKEPNLASSDMEPSHTKEYLESEGINVNRGLEILGDMGTYEMAMEEFEKNYDERMGKIKTLKEQNDMANYAIEVHSMKSDSKYLGFMSLEDISYEHEMASKANDTAKVNERYDALINESTKIITIVRKYMGKE